MVRSTKRKTTEEFIASAIAVHGCKYDYSRVDYKNNKTKVEIKCNNCSATFWQAPCEHSGKQKQGCPHCGPRSVKGIDKFISEATAKHGGKYSYENAEYKTAKIKLLVTCPVHGDWAITPVAHLAGVGHGCPKCATTSVGLSKRKSQEVFLQQVEAIHGDKYDYSEMVYETKRKKVCLICPVHGRFYILPNNLLKGSSCGECFGGGYSTNKHGWLYVLKSDDIIKVGITNISAEARAKSVSKSSGKKFSKMMSLYSEDGRVANLAETNLLRLFREEYKPVKESFEGYTECFLGMNYEDIIVVVLEEFKRAQEILNDDGR